VGFYLSQDGGRSWQSISPAWPVWDLAFGPDGRFFAATSIGLVWADNLAADPVAWQISDGLTQVFFFSVDPHPTDPNLIWAGTWGNNVAVSLDGGQSVEPIHHGLETLSVLDLIWHATPGQVTVGTIEGLYRTDNGGQSWFQLPGLLSHQTIYSLLQSDDGAIWAGAADGLWVSHDYGVNWQRIEMLPSATVLRLGRVDSAQSESWLWAGTEGAGLWLSRDDGQTWVFGGLAGQSVYTLFTDSVQPNWLVAATASGMMRARLNATLQP
jgi:ligand-binding sensor domain-containing protein